MSARALCRSVLIEIKTNAPDTGWLSELDVW